MSAHGVRTFARRANIAAQVVIVFAYLEMAAGIAAGVVLIVHRHHDCAFRYGGFGGFCSSPSHPWVAAGVATIVGAIVFGCLLLMVCYYVRMRSHAAALDYAADLAEPEPEPMPGDRQWAPGPAPAVLPAPSAWPGPPLLPQPPPSGYSGPGYSASGPYS